MVSIGLEYNYSISDDNTLGDTMQILVPTIATTMMSYIADFQ